MNFSPFKDFAVWVGSFAPSQDLETMFQLMGFGLSFFLPFALFCVLGMFLERNAK